MEFGFAPSICIPPSLLYIYFGVASFLLPPFDQKKKKWQSK
jgi:hypothetical protein